MSTFENIQDDYRKLMDTLTKQRDELRVQIHLASMEAKSEWCELESKWRHMMAKSKQAGEVVGDTADEVKEQLIDLAHEIKDGYKRIREIL